MNYSLAISVKVEGPADKYIKIAEPELAHPTYNLSKILRECMYWDYSQGYSDKSGNFKIEYYKCSDIIGNVKRGIDELEAEPDVYKQYESENGWGTIQDALDTLYSIEDCIETTSEKFEIPLDYLYFSW